MERERDIVGLTILLSAGTLAGVFLSVRLGGTAILVPCILMILFCAAALFSILTYKPLPIFSLIFMTGLSCAVIAGNGRGFVSSRDPITAAAIGTAGKAKDVIDAIPYESEATGALVKALTTGDRSDLSSNTKEVFRKSGASHILALSGLHLGIIYMILIWATAFMGKSMIAKWLKYILIVGSMFFYTIATGAAPSIVRAFLFILINETGRILGRKPSLLRVYCVALCIQLLMDPFVLQSLGFQLSYLAMAGIVLLLPKLQAWWPDDGSIGLKRKLDMPRKIWDAAALAISCQLFTSPLVWLKFHTFPKYFLITNLFAMPITTGVMITSVATIALSALGICPLLLVHLNEALVSALIFILEIISGM